MGSTSHGRSGLHRSGDVDESIAGPHDFTDDRRRLPMSAEACECRFGSIPGDDDDHADTAIEAAMHFSFGDASVFEPVEDRRSMPAIAIERDAESLREHARDVLGEPAARDVRQPLESVLGMAREDAPNVDSRRLEKQIDQARVADTLLGRTGRTRQRLADQ
jgi:hypothetical protein